jgi:2-oxoisovalerate dehydrogenase E2 component (dihydrolipoyl transacylase)
MTRQVFTLPDLGEGLADAELIRWLVQVGDTVAVDAPVAEVETAKATVEMPSPYAGVVAELHGAEGTTIDVGAPLISVDPVGEPAAAAYVEEERAGSGNVLIGYGTSGESGSGRRRRLRRAVPAPHPQATTPAGERPKVKSPIVRRLARRNGLDLATVTGTGPDGLITRADVERASTPAAPADPAPAETAAAETAPAGPGVDRRTGLPIRERIALRGMRKAITQTLSRSRPRPRPGSTSTPPRSWSSAPRSPRRPVRRRHSSR